MVFTAVVTHVLEPHLTTILFSLAVALALPLILHTLLYRAGQATSVPLFLVLGPSGSGKTSFVASLSQGRVPCTLTTQSSTSTIITLPLSDTDGLDYRSGNDPSARQTCQFEDLPGHGKFRRLAFERLSQADQLKGVIFVVDAANLTPEDASFRDTISFLYMVLLALQRSSTLTRTSKVPVSTSVLVAVNKEDLFTALPANDVKGLLEVEITRLRDASDRQLPESGSVRDSDWIGPETEDFKFSDMTHLNIDISVIGGSALNRGELDACGWQKWVSMHAS